MDLFLSSETGELKSKLRFWTKFHKITTRLSCRYTTCLSSTNKLLWCNVPIIRVPYIMCTAQFSAAIKVWCWVNDLNSVRWRAEMLNIDWRNCLCPFLMARNFTSHFKLNMLWWLVPPFTVTVTLLATTHRRNNEGVYFWGVNICGTDLWLNTAFLPW